MSVVLGIAVGGSWPCADELTSPKSSRKGDIEYNRNKSFSLRYRAKQRIMIACILLQVVIGKEGQVFQARAPAAASKGDDPRFCKWDFASIWCTRVNVGSRASFVKENFRLKRERVRIWSWVGNLCALSQSHSATVPNPDIYKVAQKLITFPLKVSFFLPIS
jgi:hypothetical protein